MLIDFLLVSMFIDEKVYCKVSFVAGLKDPLIGTSVSLEVCFMGGSHKSTLWMSVPMPHVTERACIVTHSGDQQV